MSIYLPVRTRLGRRFALIPGRRFLAVRPKLRLEPDDLHSNSASRMSAYSMRCWLMQQPRTSPASRWNYSYRAVCHEESERRNYRGDLAVLPPHFKGGEV